MLATERPTTVAAADPRLGAGPPAPPSTLQLGQGPGRAPGSGRPVEPGVAPGEVPQGQPVRVGRHQADPARPRRPSARRSGAAGRRRWTRPAPPGAGPRPGPAAGRNVARSGGLGQHREVVQGEVRSAEARPGGGDLDLVVLRLEGHRARLERADDVGQQLRRRHDRHRRRARWPRLDTDGQVQVGARHRSAGSPPTSIRTPFRAGTSAARELHGPAGGGRGPRPGCRVRSGTSHRVSFSVCLLYFY